MLPHSRDGLPAARLPPTPMMRPDSSRSSGRTKSTPTNPTVRRVVPTTHSSSAITRRCNGR